jgi:hypothetical protein
MAAAWLHDTTERPWFESIRFDAVGIVLDARGALVSLDQLEGAF